MDTTKSPLPKRKRTPTRGGGGVYPRLASGAAGACDLGTPLTQSTYAGRTYMLKTAAKHAHAQLRGPTPQRRRASVVAAARKGRGGMLAPPGGATPDRRGQALAANWNSAKHSQCQVALPVPSPHSGGGTDTRPFFGRLYFGTGSAKFPWHSQCQLPSSRESPVIRVVRIPPAPIDDCESNDRGDQSPHRLRTQCLVRG